jgi:hypothetical protein
MMGEGDAWAQGKLPHNFVSASGEGSRPYQIGVTQRICIPWLWYIEDLILRAVRPWWLVELMSIRQGRVSSPPAERKWGLRHFW